MGNLVFFILLYKMIELDFPFMLIFLRFADTFTWMIPPAMPIFFGWCMTFSLYRLKKKGIFGTNPEKTLVAGRVTTMCFDKTGTLTTNFI
jgi:cation-transporting ATPase 13A2